MTNTADDTPNKDKLKNPPAAPQGTPAATPPGSGFTGGGHGIASGHDPGGTLPGGGPAAGLGSLGTGGASTGGAPTGSVKRGGK